MNLADWATATGVTSAYIGPYRCSAVKLLKSPRQGTDLLRRPIRPITTLGLKSLLRQLGEVGG